MSRCAGCKQAWQEAIPRLLLFDNCEDEALLAQWRPKTGGCRVLATSRRATWDVSLGVATLPLDTLTPPESRALLLSLLFPLKRPLQTTAPGVEASAGDAPQIATLDAIAEELGHLPLALHLAGSYLHTYRHTPFAQPAASAELQKGAGTPSLQGEGRATPHRP
ncbi:MAG: hypothetical protein IPL78_12030 [Chloroflexi bacterium]|nr:hypothetical protein [Chloroflexota bacterium]